MRSVWLLTMVPVAITTAGVAPAWALAGGGFAPGGPMSGSIRPSCNGYNMDGTRNTSPGADRPGCIDRSANALRRPEPAVRERLR